MTQALRASWNSLNVALRRDILGYISNDSHVVPLACVSKSFQDALSKAMWKEWVADRAGSGYVTLDRSITVQNSLSMKELPDEEIHRRLVSSLERVKTRINSLKAAAEAAESVALQKQASDQDEKSYEEQYIEKMGLFYEPTKPTTRQLIKQIKQEVQDSRVFLRGNRLDSVVSGFDARIFNVKLGRTSRKMIERLSSDLAKAEKYSLNMLIFHFCDKVGVRVEADLVSRAKTIMMEQARLGRGEPNIFACYAKLQEQQKIEASITAEREERFDSALKKWKGAFSLERFLELEHIAHGWQVDTASKEYIQASKEEENLPAEKIPTKNPQKIDVFRKWFIETFAIPVDCVHSWLPLVDWSFLGAIQNIAHGVLRTLALWWNLIIVILIEPAARRIGYLLGYQN